jgi:ribosomal-protein-alanine N-acetyltransferase
MSEVTLREYRSGDFEAMFTLDEICFSPAFRFSRAAMRRFAETKRARVVVAERGGKLVGFCIVHLERGGVGYIVTLDVAPEERRGGLARRMVLELERRLRAEGVGVMVLHVSTENPGAVRFYEALGYAAAHTEEDFYGDGLDAVVYRKGLSEAS